MSREFIREDYLKLEIKLNPVLPAREVAIAWLSELEFEVFESTDWGLIAHTPLLNVNQEQLDEVKQRLVFLVDEITWDQTTVETENWNAKWEEEYEAVNVEGRALVRAPFHTPPAQGLDVVIKPNMSFGTGHHETTWMMLKALLSMSVDGAKVLDMGCGTGVLAIAAKKLGASSVLAIDIEEGAVENTVENASLNFILPGEEFIVDCGISSLLTNKYTTLNDIILANINRNVLVEDMGAYVQVLSPEGLIAFSGFFTGDVPLMTEHIESHGLEVVKVLEREGWACIVCGKTQA
ncbi:MAG: 50S ribosomal protein L11 methyltransferase [Crocinitomicaceae bacterium]|nr:50S ribosomal protein L11 methyltransferase [Crocinitomicaceae bacterium]|tara:strand:- start:1612 stop:2490 length:879 start_codon:yes stop_codon:yes gene_type:complete